MNFKHTPDNRQRGFTLIELMAVIVILALLSGIVIPKVWQQVQKAKITTAKSQIENLSAALQRFYMDCGFFPTTEQGLQTLLEKPSIGRQCKNYDEGGYLDKKKLPKDPFGNDYVYKSPGVKRPDSFDLLSKGPDGEEGNEDDIVSWE